MWSNQSAYRSIILCQIETTRRAMTTLFDLYAHSAEQRSIEPRDVRAAAERLGRQLMPNAELLAGINHVAVSLGATISQGTSIVPGVAFDLLIEKESMPSIAVQICRIQSI